jgi:hypothetical protein
MQIGKPCIVYLVIVTQWSLISNKFKKHQLLLLLLLYFWLNLLQIMLCQNNTLVIGSSTMYVVVCFG